MLLFYHGNKSQCGNERGWMIERKTTCTQMVYIPQLLKLIFSFVPKLILLLTYRLHSCTLFSFKSVKQICFFLNINIYFGLWGLAAIQCYCNVHINCAQSTILEDLVWLVVKSKQIVGFPVGFAFLSNIVETGAITIAMHRLINLYWTFFVQSDQILPRH